MVKNEVKIASIVILYNPAEDVLKNIESYANQAGYLFIFDNSANVNLDVKEWASKNDNVEYIFNDGNLGISTIINKGAAIAFQKGYTYLLTMDQDSWAQQSLVQDLLKIFLHKSNVAIAVPSIINRNYPIKSTINKIYEVDHCITSGSLIKLDAFQKVGGYDERLFIDYVDFDFSFKIRNAGYRIHKNPCTKLIHSVGDLKKWEAYSFNFFSTNHPPIRLYFRTRNRFYIRKKYKRSHPEFFRKDFISFFKELAKILLVESNKIEKLKMIYLGLLDYKVGKFDRFKTI